MSPCFICSKPANSIRSLTMLTAPPASSQDAICICPHCTDSLDFALIQILAIDLADDRPTGEINLTFNRSPSHLQF